MRGRLAVLAVLALSGLAGGAHAQKDRAPLMLEVACGDLNRAACARVVPGLAAAARSRGLGLRAMEAANPLNAMAAICHTRPTAAVALVPRDAVGALTYCAAELAGGPLWPAHAFLVVRAGTQFRQLGDLAREAASGRKRVIVVDDMGEIMLDRLLRTNPVWRRAIAVIRDSADSGLARVASGAADAFFTVDTPDGDWAQRVRRMTTPDGKPRHGFLDIHPSVAFFQESDGRGHCLYRRTRLDVGEAEPITTVATDIVMVLGAKSRETRALGGPRVADVLAAALETARVRILTDMRVPREWRPAGVACRAPQPSGTETTAR